MDSREHCVAASTARTTTPLRRQLWQLVDLIGASLRGVAADDLLDPRGFAAIDDEDFRDWITRHGAEPEMLDSPLVSGVYDLVFGYQPATTPPTVLRRDRPATLGEDVLRLPRLDLLEDDRGHG